MLNSIYFTCVTTINNYTIHQIRGEPATWEAHEMIPKSASRDRLKALYDAAGAELSMGLESKRSGPPNSYSSVTLTVLVKVRVKQDAESVEEAKRLLYSTCEKIIEEYSAPSMQLLESHL